MVAIIDTTTTYTVENNLTKKDKKIGSAVLEIFHTQKLQAKDVSPNCRKGRKMLFFCPG